MIARTCSADETEALAEAIGGLMRAGDVVVLAGDLGTGKTVFAKGVARALGVCDTVVSPTFTIVREYQGRVGLAHLDVFRLDDLQELHDVGFDELVGGERVTLVEWGDVVASALPADRLEVVLERRTAPDASDDERVITLSVYGASWAERAEALERVMAHFGTDPVEADGGQSEC